MSNFKKFRDAVQKQFKSMCDNFDVLFQTDVPRQDLWDKYLEAFPGEIGEGVDSQAQEHNCNSCKQFIRPFSNMVGITPDNELVSIWDNMSEHGVTDPLYLQVANEMSTLVKSQVVSQIFVNDFAKLGTDHNVQTLEGGDKITRYHFHLKLPSKFLLNRRATSNEAFRGSIRDSKNVFKRSLEEITQESIETVLELIAQGSLYRGSEFKEVLKKFLAMHKEYHKLPEDQKDNYCWRNSKDNPVARIRNNAIGTLLTDISEKKDLERAVTAFERIMAPANYKRPKAIYTKKMLEEAKKQVEDMGLINSLGRRHALVEDVTINNVLFADRDTKPQMQGSDPFQQLEKDIKVNTKKFDRVEEIKIEDFVENVLPNIQSMEVMVENKHQSNLFSLIAPKDSTAPSLFKWDNNFSWAYNGDMTDSIKEKVKAAGGRVEGELRTSLAWFNYDDLDLHVKEPNGNHIYYGNRHSNTGGNLDVDMNAGGRTSRSPVENIIWPNKIRMLEGQYEIWVHQYSKRETKDFGFTLEIECNGQIHTFNYDKPVTGNVKVATIKYSKTKGMEIVKSIPSTVASKEVWGIKTQQFHPVSLMMFSPNHWNGQGVGNKHYMFVVNDCVNPENPRGFFNEFLKEDFMKHKRVFEALGNQMKVADSDNQLSGVGFSETQRNDIVVKVSGNFTRTLKLVF